MISKIFTLVVTYNGARWIEKCFTSLENSSVPLRIIAIDNGSTDETVSLIRRRFPAVEVIEAGSNLGFGKANNIGLEQALSQDADYVFLLNQDAWVECETVSTLINIMKSEIGYGIVSPFHLSVKGDGLERQFQDFLSFDNSGSFASDSYINRVKTVYQTNYIHAACWLMSKECLKKVGGFDPLFYHYGEDDDYMERVKFSGLKLGIVPRSRITHDSTYKSWREIEWDENRNIIIAYKRLKTMSPHFRSNLLYFLKTEVDELTSLLLFRKFRKLIFRFKLFWLVIYRLPKIYSSYKTSFKPGAFLRHD